MLCRRQVQLYSPRVTHLDLYTKAYTPKRLYLTPYIVYSLVIGFLILEVLYLLL